MIFDSFVSLALTFIAAVVTVVAVVAMGSNPSGPTVLAVMLLVGVLPWAAYWYVPVARTGQTLGKKILGIRIVRSNDMRSAPGWGWALLRAVVSGLLGAVPFLIGQLANLVAAGVDPHSRALHDRAARTRVVNEQNQPRHGVTIALSVIAAVLVVNLVLAAIAIPVFLNQRTKGIESFMAKDAEAVGRHLVAEAKAGRITEKSFPLVLPAGATGPIGATTFTPAPDNTVTATLIPGPQGYFCVRVDNKGARIPTFLNSSDGSISHTPCDGSTPVQQPVEVPRG